MSQSVAYTHPVPEACRTFLQSPPWEPSGALGVKPREVWRTPKTRPHTQPPAIPQSLMKHSSQFLAPGATAPGKLSLAMIFCFHMSVQFSGWHFALWLQFFDGCKERHWFQFAHLFSCYEDGSDDFQALYMSVLKLEVLYMPFTLFTSIWRVYLSTPGYGEETWSSERLSNVPRVTQLMGGRAKILCLLILMVFEKLPIPSIPEMFTL